MPLLLPLTSSDERALRMPVIAGLVAMVLVATVMAWAQAWWQRRRQAERQAQLLRPHEPRSHVRVEPPYDWQRRDPDLTR